MCSLYTTSLVSLDSVSEPVGLTIITEKASGTIRTAEVCSSAALSTAASNAHVMLQQVPDSSLDTNLQAFKTNAETMIEGSECQQAAQQERHDYDRATLCSKFLSSLSLSVTSTLCKSGPWTRIGSDCCIGSFRDQESRTDLFNIEKDLILLSVTLHWLPFGSLAITGIISSTKHLRRLSDFNVHERSSLAKANKDVIVAPSGLKAKLIDHNPTKQGQMTDMIIQRLSHQQSNIERVTEWVTLQFYGGGDAFTMQKSTISLWPMQLCFVVVERNQVGLGDSSMSQHVDVSEWTDPLEEAENWYKAKDTRAEAIERNRKAQQELAMASQNHHISDDESVLTYEDNVLQGRYQLQDISGIYPTPPDGTFPPPNPIASSQEGLSSLNARAIPSSAVNANQDSTSMVTSPIFEESPQYNNNTGGDLFGEMDSDMFAANGLTEDDFNFFDEPSPKVMFSAGQQIALPDNVLSPQDGDVLTNKYMGFDEGADIVADTENADPENQSKAAFESPHELTDKGELYYLMGYETRPAVLIYGLADIPGKHISELEPPFIRSPASSESDSKFTADRLSNKPEAGGKETYDQDIIRANGNSTTVTAIASPRVDTLDRKYSERGRYGFDNVETPEGTVPCEPLGREKLESYMIRESADSDSLLSDSETTAAEEGDINQADGDLKTDRDFVDNALGVDRIELLEDNLSTNFRTDGHVLSTESPHSSLKRKRERSVTSGDHLSPSDSDMPPDLPIQDVYDMPGVPDDGLFSPSTVGLREKLPGLPAARLDQFHGFISLGDPKQYLQVAQLLIEQVSQTSGFSNLLSIAPPSVLHHAVGARDLHDTLEVAIQGNFQGAKRCHLKEVPRSVQQNLVPPVTDDPGSPSSEERFSMLTASATNSSDQGGLSKIATPLACVRRLESQVDISVSALPFWEELGLGPVSGEKDILAFCICPNVKYIEERVKCFLDTVSISYEGCKLGTHRLGSGLPGYEGALVSVAAKDGPGGFKGIFDACTALGKRKFRCVFLYNC